MRARAGAAAKVVLPVVVEPPPGRLADAHKRGIHSTRDDRPDGVGFQPCGFCVLFNYSACKANTRPI